MKRFFMLGMVLPLLFLSACGEGWEMRTYSDTPYGERTAGSGVEYVREHMMREKGTVIKRESKKVAVPAPAEEVSEEKDSGVIDKMINSGEKFFSDLHKK